MFSTKVQALDSLYNSMGEEKMVRNTHIVYGYMCNTYSANIMEFMAV